MLVKRSQVVNVLRKFDRSGCFGLDTETTGLQPYNGDKLFSIILADEIDSYYFNFSDNPSFTSEEILDDSHKQMLRGILANPGARWYLANAKFDMGMLDNEGIDIHGDIHCISAIGRVVYNRRLKYSLGSEAKLIGEEKSSAVDDYIKKHKLFDLVTPPGKKKREKLPHFELVPKEVIVPYAEIDASLVRRIGIHQESQLSRIVAETPRDVPSMIQVSENEKRLTKTCFRMEKIGVKINREFCRKALVHEQQKMQEASLAFESLCGLPFNDGRNTLVEAFTKLGLKYPLTKKKNPSFTDDVLEDVKHPLAETIRNFRDANKRAGTYYSSFLYYADNNDILHANIRQGGTDTGRVSYSTPNLQNIPKEEDTSQEFVVRRAFIPRSPDTFLGLFDYQQMEYRMMVEYAGEMHLVEAILGGLDVHEATAQLMGITRKEAKTINFMLLYGGGPGKLAAALGISLESARALKDRYFETLPNVRRFSRACMEAADQRGFIFNWLGRRCYYPEYYDSEREEWTKGVYRAPNHLIQGGCGDVVKVAMNRVDDYLMDKKSKLILQVHDELMIEIDRSEEFIIPVVKKIMETAYPYKHIPLTVDFSRAEKSWADKVKDAA